MIILTITMMVLLGERDVLQMRCSARYTLHAAESDRIWRPLVESRWPSTKALFASELVTGTSFSFYLRHAKVAKANAKWMAERHACH